MKKQFQKTDLLLLGIFLVLGLAIGGFLLLTARPGAIVEVSVAGVVTEQFSLTEDQRITIHGVGDTANELVIEGGKARVEEATCPDGLCVGMGWISRNGQSIICLPNQVVVRVVDDGADSVDEESLDAVVGGKH